MCLKASLKETYQRNKKGQWSLINMIKKEPLIILRERQKYRKEILEWLKSCPSGIVNIHILQSDKLLCRSSILMILGHFTIIIGSHLRQWYHYIYIYHTQLISVDDPMAIQIIVELAWLVVPKKQQLSVQYCCNTEPTLCRRCLLCYDIGDSIEIDSSDLRSFGF